jgi:hypothetical protein
MRRRPVLVAFLFLASVAWAAKVPINPCKSNGSGELENCPAEGCAAPRSPDASANRLRNTRPLGRGTPKPMLFADFELLQASFRPWQGLAAADRAKFRQRTRVTKTEVGEGDVVEMTGFIVGTPAARRSDPANCLLVGEEKNTFRINIARHKDDTEFESIIVAMPPHRWEGDKNVPRNADWTLEKLRWVSRNGFEVKVAGQLFFDNKHLANSDPGEVVPNEPKRLSVWEIHPVFAFQVCRRRSAIQCHDPKEAHWEPLEQMP